MYLSQEDVVAVSCSASAATTLLRQLDMELVSLKRQVGGSSRLDPMRRSVNDERASGLQGQNTKQMNSGLKHMLESRIEEFRLPEVR